MEEEEVRQFMLENNVPEHIADQAIQDPGLQDRIMIGIAENWTGRKGLSPEEATEALNLVPEQAQQQAPPEEQIQQQTTSPGTEQPQQAGGFLDWVGGLFSSGDSDEPTMEDLARQAQGQQGPVQGDQAIREQIKKGLDPSLHSLVDNLPPKILHDLASGQVKGALNKGQRGNEIRGSLPEGTQQFAPLLMNRGTRNLGTYLIKRATKDQGGQGGQAMRERLKQNLDPSIHPFIDSASDKVIENIAGGQLEDAVSAARKGNVQFSPAKGKPSLKIVQDEAFQRSGYKSGDVVCIRIP